MQELDFRKFREFDSHKLVVRIEDKEAGLRGFVAIHNDNLGLPAVGGTRMLPYRTEKTALVDVLKLSRAMTYKCALAKVPYGGGKAVIIGNSRRHKTEKLLQAYANQINALEGRFCTGEDVGITQNDVNVMLKTSHFLIGKPNLAEDPSPFAALSTFYGIESAVSFVFEKDSLSGIKVAIKGVGKVGKELARLLTEVGATIYVSDKDRNALLEIKQKIPTVEVVENKRINMLMVDVYAPCALGDEFSMRNAPRIKAKIICGGANNQLADNRVGDWFFNHDILYIPDYVANSGGLIDVVDELESGGYKKERVLERIANVKNTVREIIVSSRENNRSPHRIADELAEKYFKN